MNSAPIAVLTINAAHLPLTREKAALLAAKLDVLAGCFLAVGWQALDTTLTMVAAEYGKGEHRDTVRIAIMPNVGTDTSDVSTA